MGYPFNILFKLDTLLTIEYFIFLSKRIYPYTENQTIIRTFFFFWRLGWTGKGGLFFTHRRNVLAESREPQKVVSFF